MHGKSRLMALLKKNETINVVLYIFIQAFIVGSCVVLYAEDGFYLFIPSFFASILASAVIFLFLLLILVFLRRILSLHAQYPYTKSEEHSVCLCVLKRFLEKMVERVKKYEIINVMLHIPTQAFIVGSLMFFIAWKDYSIRDWDIDILHFVMVFVSWFIASFLASTIALLFIMVTRIFPRRMDEDSRL
jgi:hypothetical protein